MSDGGTRGAALKRFAPALWLAGGWLAAFVAARLGDGINGFLYKVVVRVLSGFPAAQSFLLDGLAVGRFTLGATWALLVIGATILFPLGFLGRVLARAGLRAGHRDPLDRVRAWTAAHPKWTRALLAAPAMLWALALTRRYHHWVDDPAQYLPLAILAAYAQYTASRAALGALLAPTLHAGEETPMEIGPNEITFDAVAVTRETKAAVGGLAGVSALMVVWIASRPILTLYRSHEVFYAMATYVAVAAASAFAFRRASRVAVGVDGVLVKGTSRTRFFAYRDLDDARVTAGDVELVKRDRVVLRLQLHGSDAVRREAVLGRIRGNIAHVKGGKEAMAAQLVASASSEQLTRVASGGADYRAASLSREALWALIEGPTVDAESRKAAAEALAKTNDEGERARMRIAAEHCADPSVRVALELLAEGDGEGAPGAEPKARAMTTRA